MHRCTLTAAAFTTILTTAVNAQVTFNEIRTEEPGAELNEYIELIGTPGASLNGMSILIIGDCDSFPPTQSGCIEEVISLQGLGMRADGLFLISEKTNSLGVPDLVVDLNHEGSDNITFMLVSSFRGNDGDDLDTNDDGILDSTPWASTMASLSILRNVDPDGFNDEQYYGDTTVGPDASGFAPSHVWKCDDGSWNIGTFEIGGPDESAGGPNPTCEIVVPELSINEIRLEQAGDEIDEHIEFRGDPGTILDGLTYIVIGDDEEELLGSGVIEAAVPLSGQIDANGYFTVAEDLDLFGTVPNQLADLQFEGSDNVTHMLVAGYSGVLNQDLDTDDDGVLDTLAWTEVVDAVSVLESSTIPPTNTEWAYAEASVGPDGIYMPGHVYRCEPEGEWTVGSFFPADNQTDTPGTDNPDCQVCGNQGSGNCFDVTNNIGCEDFDCCENVCSVDPACCTVGWDQPCVDIALVNCLTGGTAPDVIINEIRVDQPSTDTDEYFELKGAPGTLLDGVSYVVIGDSSVGSGAIEFILDLSGQVIGPDGLFVAAESTFTFGSPDLTTSLGFENSDNVTHMLLFNFTGANGGDLDVEDDCVLDSTPWDVEMDSISLVETPDSGECYYSSTTLGPNPDDPRPGHAYRCTTDGTWTIGAYDTADGTDTPGQENLACDDNGGGDNCGQGGPCCEVQGTPGCVDPICCNTVCQDPNYADCCEIAWDQNCVDRAIEVCYNGTDPCDGGSGDNCGQGGPCCEVQETPGCVDPICCNLVCKDPNYADCCEIAWDQDCVDRAIEVCYNGTDPCSPPTDVPTVLLYEIRVDQPSSDTDEYAEILGAPGTSLSGVYYVVIGDGSSTQGSGVVEMALDLSGNVIPDDGIFLIAEDEDTFGATADLIVPGGLAFENSDNVTHALVFNFNGNTGDDLDANDDCVLDSEPWGAMIDMVALVESNEEPPVNTECFYGDVYVGPVDEDGDGTFFPATVIYRCPVDLGSGLIGCETPSGTCGSSTAGSCFEVHSTPFCNQKDCCNAVCFAYPDCCTNEWDQGCVDLANQCASFGGSCKRWVHGTYDTSLGISDTPGAENLACDDDPKPTPCNGDFNNDGKVDGEDLGALLGAWGTFNCDIDIAGDKSCLIDGEDLGALLGNWGDCKE